LTPNTIGKREYKCGKNNPVSKEVFIIKALNKKNKKNRSVFAANRELEDQRIRWLINCFKEGTGWFL
jgi:hypothetical protein